jgi:hypothetical protein
VRRRRSTPSHDFQELNFECFLSFDPCFEIDEFLGNVLATDVFLRCVAGELLDLVKRGAELRRGNSDHQLDVQSSLRGIDAVALF